MLRRLAATLAAFAIVLLLAAPAMAGGWAEIVADAKTAEPLAEPPVEDQPLEVGFLVLQHGQTPAGWETPTVHFTNASTGEIIEVVATNDRDDGHFVAGTTLPEAGYWSWQVTLRDLASEHLPVALPVATASGRLPAFDPSTALTAIAAARQQIAHDIGARYLPELERLDGLVRAEGAKGDRLLEQTQALAAERDELIVRLAALEAEGVGRLPLLGVLTLAILAGATAGFAMSWLGGRPGPRVTLNPVPRGVDPG